MLCAVVLTHSNGVRLSREQLRVDSPAVGNLMVREYDAHPARKGKYARLAYRGPLVRADLLKPIFDIQLVKMVDQGFLLQGYEIESKDGVTREYVQGWWCKPASPGSW